MNALLSVQIVFCSPLAQVCLSRCLETALPEVGWFSVVISFFSLAFFSVSALENREIPSAGRNALFVDTERDQSSLADCLENLVVCLQLLTCMTDSEQ